MRIAIIHSFYRAESPSGENETVLQQQRILNEGGFDVELFSVNTDDLRRKASYEISTAINFSLGRGTDLRQEISHFAPSLVHVHNLFPNISESAVSRLGIPYVITLHNYRHLCAAATFTRDSKRCFKCLRIRGLPSAIHSCYKDSVLASAPLAIRNLRSPDNRPLLQRASQLIFPSAYSRDVFAKSLDISRSRVVHQPGPNVSEFVQQSPKNSEDYWIFIGRLVVEKGLLELLKTWPPSRKLLIAGNGPLEKELHRIAYERNLDVVFKGSISHGQVLRDLSQARGLVFTSIWPEVAPLVYAEALALGKPVLSHGQNAVTNWVQAHGTGQALFDASPQSWLSAMDRVMVNEDGYKRHCIDVYRREFAESAWLARIRTVYEEVLDTTTN